jgi:hypothetical protein
MEATATPTFRVVEDQMEGKYECIRLIYNPGNYASRRQNRPAGREIPDEH